MEGIEMGYSTHPLLVEEAAEFLRELRDRLKKDRRAVIRSTGNVSTSQWKMRRLLTACDRHPEAAKGEFVGLGASTVVRVRDAHSLLLEWKGPPSLEVLRVDEADVLRELSDYPGSLRTLEFVPSENFSLEAFRKAVNSLGWILHENTRAEEDGAISFAVEKEEKEETGFSFLDE